MTLKINNEDITLVYSFRSALYFEQITGHNLDFNTLSANDLVTLFYSVVMASLQKAKKPVITMIDFLDVVDDNGGDRCLTEFTNWYVEVLKAQYEVLVEEADQKQKKTSKKKTN
jgi:hypothetical protein